MYADHIYISAQLRLANHFSHIVAKPISSSLPPSLQVNLQQAAEEGIPQKMRANNSHNNVINWGSAAAMDVRFKRVSAALDEAARLRLCESTGSDDHSSSPDLSDLVNSFIETPPTTDDYDDGSEDPPEIIKSSKFVDDDGIANNNNYKDMLQNLLANNKDEHHQVREKIRAETQLACAMLKEGSPQSFNRRFVMSRLRDSGFDAGVCKCRWEKFGRHPAGEYEYIDVNVGVGKRYIVEVMLAAQFEIARPTTSYSALLDVVPNVLVVGPEELKQIVRLICSAVRESMKGMGIPVPPWRRNGYMQAKWFSNHHHHKRLTTTTTTNSSLVQPQQATTNPPHIYQSGHHHLSAKTSSRPMIGFQATQAVPWSVYRCRDDCVSSSSRRAAMRKPGFLTAAFTGGGDMV